MNNTPSSSYTPQSDGESGGVRTVRFLAPVVSRICGYVPKSGYCHANDRYGVPLTEEQYNALPIEVRRCPVFLDSFFGMTHLISNKPKIQIQIKIAASAAARPAKYSAADGLLPQQPLSFGKYGYGRMVLEALREPLRVLQSRARGAASRRAVPSAWPSPPHRQFPRARRE